MRILVTGGFGYLGGRIAKRLAEQGHKVVLGSRKEQSVPTWLSQAEVVKLTWNDKDILQSVCEKVDIVIHTAGMNAEDCALDPVGAIEFNGVVTARLVQASIVAGVSKFIYLSTVHVYDSPLAGEITEETCPINKHPYATSHIAAEDAVLYQANTRDNFTSIVLRLSGGVGVPTHKNPNCWMLAVNNFCRQVVEDGKIEVNSPRGVVRDFVPISLICEAIASIVDSCKVDESVINISSSKVVSLQDITDMIRERAELLLGFKPEVIFKNREIVKDRSNLVISNSKLKKIVEVETNLEIEIDQLLLECKKWFGV